MAANRLFLMVSLLLKKGRMTAPQLAEYFEVSVRTIYRDIDILSASGIPVYTTQGKGGGISLQENFVMNQALISEQEQTQILMALQSISLLDRESTDLLLAKLGSIFQKQNINWIEVDESDWNRECSNLFYQLKLAIFQSTRVLFQYCSATGERSMRKVEPLKLVCKNREWYLFAYCCIRKDHRLFKLTRIRQLSHTNEEFIRTAPAQVIEKISSQKQQEITLTLLFRKEMAYSVFDHFDQITETEDGCFLVQVSLPDNAWLYQFLLSFGDQVLVISPESVKEELRNKIAAMQKNYKT